ncbi:MAG: hypothetical protein J0M18_18485 [Ignavibacteria bacterium]|nr:hypothetical protein [Ignavibacteria bacterium]
MNYKEDILKKYKDVKPGFLTFVKEVAAGSTTIMSITLDKSSDFFAEAITGFAYNTADITAVGYFTVTQINLGLATNSIQGQGIHSKYFSQFTAMPIRFNEVFEGGRDIQFTVTNHSAFTSSVNIIIQGKQLIGKI